jgi:hypothetical protein
MHFFSSIVGSPFPFWLIAPTGQIRSAGQG